MWHLFVVLACAATSIDAVLNANDNRYKGGEADRYDWSKHPCNRKCSPNDKPRLCEYVFVVEQYSTMSKACYDCPFNLTDCFRPHCLPGDGVPKRVYTVNRRLPGPPIEVCQNDVIQVDVRNVMLSEGTTVHWHGIDQLDTPYADGVPYVTQCPILPENAFNYTFYADDPGTFFWHSHIGSQRADGFFGTLIIRPYPNEDAHRELYDFDVHRMIVLDWSHAGGDDELVSTFHAGAGNGPNSMLINGQGRFQLFQRANQTSRYTPAAVFEVQKGKRYRFRLISAGAENCPCEMSVDNHTMKVISLDSNDIEPVEVDVITISPGERVDFIIEAKSNVNNYWFRYRGLGLCSIRQVNQVAILRYTGAPVRDPTGVVGYAIPPRTNTTRILNPFDRGTESSSQYNLSIPLMKSVDPNDIALKKVADQQVYISFDFYSLDNYDYHRKGLYGYNQVSQRVGTLQLNHISLKMPSFPLLSQYDLIGKDSLCNASTIPKRCQTEQCTCTHVIQLKLNNVVELIFVDEGNFLTFNHPFHLHGHFFRVVAEENVPGNVTVDYIKKLDREGKLKRNLDHAPLKDTIKAPGGGYTIVRFLANNPGFWFFHCHFEPHLNIGMALVFQVGEYKDFVKPPKNFPKCGSYVPNPL